MFRVENKPPDPLDDVTFSEPRGSLRRPTCVHLVGASSVAGSGGSNTFIQGLAERQTALGWAPIVVTNQAQDKGGAPHSASDRVTDREESRVPTRILPPVQGTNRRAYYARRPSAAPGVRELFDELRPAVVHFHTLGLAAGLLHLEAAKAVNARTIVTYHTGGISCPQTGLLENGRTPCDGRLDVARCTRCRFANKGMPARLADILARIEAGGFNSSDDTLVARLMSSREMTKLFINSFMASVDLIDVFHIQARWIEKVLRANGVPTEKIAFVEMGVSQRPISVARTPIQSFTDVRPLRLVFAGRCSDIKGIETILGALKLLPRHAPICVSLLGAGWDSHYGRRLLAPFAADRRLLPPRVVSTGAILNELSAHDACLVPSVWLETGPLAVYEAMAAGLPVIGTRLGGIAERVRDNIDGILFPPGNAKELARIIQMLIAAPMRLNELRRNVQPQRTFDDMTRELDILYRGLMPSMTS